MLHARPWGAQGTTRAGSNAETDGFGNPLWAASDKAIVDAVERMAAERGVHGAGGPGLGVVPPGRTIWTTPLPPLELHLTDTEVEALEAPYVPRTPTYFA